MNDLLDEEDFLEKEYSPKKWFGRFYIGAIISEIIILITFKFIPIKSGHLSVFVDIFSGFVFPVGLAMLIVLGKKEILLDTKKSKITKGVLMLFTSFCIIRTMHMGYTYYTFYLQNGLTEGYVILLMPVCMLAILYGISLAIIIPLVNRSRKKQQSLTDYKNTTR